jgi:hypothetical protein
MGQFLPSPKGEGVVHYRCMEKKQIINQINSLIDKIDMYKLLCHEAAINGPFDLQYLWINKVYSTRMQIAQLRNKLNRL